jgi:flagellar FliL protein
MTTMVDTAAAPAETEPAKGGKKKLIIIGVLVVALLAGGYYWFMLRPSGKPQKPDPGSVLALDAIQVNLAGPHYLRIGIALQEAKGAPTTLDGSQALDATIALFTGKSMNQLADTAYRSKLKTQLEHTLDKSYDGQVIGVYFTDFVTQ